MLLLVINNDSSKVRKHGETYEVAGVRFTADQIPKIDTNKLLEIKACNNIIDFGQNHYFKSLDIPYGEDLWCLEYPSNYRFWEKID